MSTKRRLTVKQQAFADYYIETGNATQSAIRAGYSKKTAAVIGSENIIKPNIKEYINDKLEEMASKRIMSAREALELLTGIANGEVTDNVVVSGGWGYEVIDKPPDINQRKDAAKELLKRYAVSRNDELRDEMLEAQIKKLQKDLETESSTEDKLQEYFDKLDGAFDE